MKRIERKLRIRYENRRPRKVRTIARVTGRKLKEARCA